MLRSLPRITKGWLWLRSYGTDNNVESGGKVTTDVETAVEIQDFTRFATATQFVSYLGLCPGEDSSGKTKNMLPLTKAGNKRVRALFCESAKAIKRTNPYGQKSKRILERQKNASPEIVAYADKVTKRIRTKMKHLEERGKNYNVSSASGAIELAGLCTDICVISNALLLKTKLPEVPVCVDSSCCAGVTPESHQNALNAMKMCQIGIL